MRRGPKISQGLTLAIPFALKRGHVMVFMAALLNLAEFLITGNGLFVLVRVRLARRIHAGIVDIEAEFADAITGLRLIPRTGPVSCELWLYSRHGTLRHFRIEDARLVEIDCYGTPLDQVKPVTEPTLIPDKTGISSGPASAGTVQGPASPVIDPKSPIYRWLVKWNAARKAGESAGPAGSSELKKILDTGKPGGAAKQNAGKKPARKKSEEASPDEPEKRQGPEEPVADEMPALPSETASSHGRPSSGGNAGSPEHSGNEPPSVPGRIGEEI